MVAPNNHSVYDNSENTVLGIFWGILFIVHGELSKNLKGPLLFAQGYLWLPLATTWLLLVIENLMFKACLEVYYLILMKDSLKSLKVHHWSLLITISCPIATI